MSVTLSNVNLLCLGMARDMYMRIPSKVRQLCDILLSFSQKHLNLVSVVDSASWAGGRNTPTDVHVWCAERERERQRPVFHETETAIIFTFCCIVEQLSLYSVSRGIINNSYSSVPALHDQISF